MEELVGRWWHHAVSHLARNDHAQAVVHLHDMQKTIGILFRAAGGPTTVRFAPASARPVGGQRHWLQKLAGSAKRADTAQLEPEVLALPTSLAVFPSTQLNHDLYLWLAMLSASFTRSGNWVADNQRASQNALAHFPGFTDRHQALVAAHLAQRPNPDDLNGAASLAETAVQAALQGHYSSQTACQPQDVAAVWLWLSASIAVARPASHKPADERSGALVAIDKQRRRSQSTTHEQSRNALVLPFRGEALMSWSEMVHVNRSSDDEDDGNALNAANDMDQLSVAPDGQTLASRVKFDLDLPSASADDIPLGPGLALPEWDYRRQTLKPDHCRIQIMQARAPEPFRPPAALRSTARHLRRRLETLRDAPRALHGQDSGEDIDLDAWVRFSADQLGGRVGSSDTPPVYTRQARCERSLATLLLADLSLSTDAYASPDARVIDVTRDALFVFGEALAATGDAFAMWGFSSVRRHHVRMQHLKPFHEPWAAAAQARLGAIRPGYYTRMGAAIRFATLQLRARPEKKRLLMLLTDGKPNDLDEYEGRYGLEDTRCAVREAHVAGLTPFCVTIDETAHDYLPMLFGAQGYAMVRRPPELIKQLTQAWANLSRR